MRQQHTCYKEVSLVNNIVYAKMFRIEESSAEATIFETYLSFGTCLPNLFRYKSMSWPALQSLKKSKMDHKLAYIFIKNGHVELESFEC